MAKQTINPIWLGKVYNSHFIPHNLEKFRLFLQGFNGQDVTVIVRRKRKMRSINQNNYYWGVVIPLISDSTGATADEVHEALKWKFLKKSLHAYNQTNKKHLLMNTARSTADLSTVEFEEFLEKVRVFAQTDLNIKIPLPNEADLGLL